MRLPLFAYPADNLSVSNHWWKWSAACIAVVAIVAAIWAILSRPVETAEHEIFRGVTYQCTIYPSSSEVRGAAHIVIADLSVPGISLFVTPMDQDALARGWEYRLDYVSSVAKRENLAIAINGGYFAADSRFMDSKGDYAVSTEVAIADHRPNHINLHSYMLWFDDDQIPHVEYNKPPRAEAIRRAKWCLSGQMVVLQHGEVNPYADPLVDKRVALGFNATTKKLYIAAFEHASPSFAAATLAKLGATDAVMMDGGGSTTMVIGNKTVLGGWRPVATTFGIHANPLQTN